MKEESTVERSSSLGSTIATIGSILIAVGFAWLIADNWNVFPDILKVLILLLITASALIGGVLFRTHDYYKIGSSLIVLGSLLFTLTIFLIAQIYNLSTGLQGNAWLILICWIGVALIAYSLDSSSSLIIAMSEFLIWIMLQHIAFAETSRNSSIFGPMALSYLLVGVIFYGLSLLHKSQNHKFHKVYMWWTLFYITIYTFIFTFLRLIPSIWPSGITMSSSALIFLIVLFIFALISFLSGVIASLSSGKTTIKEIIVFMGTIVLLLIMILSSSIVSSQVGTCYAKNCYDFDTKASCLVSNAGYDGRGCLWEQNQCAEKNCYSLKSESTCTSAQIEDQICKWQNNFCTTVSCNSFSTKDECLLNSKANCFWQLTSQNGDLGYCDQNYSRNIRVETPNSDEKYQTCSKLSNQRNSCLSKDICGWRGGELGYGYYGQTTSIPFSLWALWIFSNIIFIILILAIIAYGTMNGSQKIVNLGILFFTIDLISRYIGFWIDYYRSSIAILSIIGGILLIVGGWLIEKWRKNLIEKVHQNENR